MRRWDILAPVLWGLGSLACAKTGATASPLQPKAQSTAEPQSELQGHDAEEPQGPHPLEDGRQADPNRALPRLAYTHLGMHIGGEPNDSESKRPWLGDIEAGDEKLLLCYRLVDEPMKGGSFGVDLYVGTAGGAPEVRATRQKMGGEQFEQCMKRAFESLRFHSPERPTMLSYSILFEMK